MAFERQLDVKISYGIICMRKHPVCGRQILLIKKPVTYCFCEFVSGNYSKSDDSKLTQLFNGMSYMEKMDIRTMDFKLLWYRKYKTLPNAQVASKFYNAKKAKFENTFVREQRLHRLLLHTTNIDPIWEIPKGRKMSDESNVEVAMREFYEETGVEPAKYKVLLDIAPFVESFVDYGTIYKNVYYYAEAIDMWEQSISFANNVQIAEVSDVKWCGINEIKIMCADDNRRINMLKKIFAIYRTHTSQSAKLHSGGNVYGGVANDRVANDRVTDYGAKCKDSPVLGGNDENTRYTTYKIDTMDATTAPNHASIVL